MTTIREFADSVHAGLIISFLKDNDIDAVLFDENSSAWAPAKLMVPIRLQVADHQVEQANKLLDEFDAAPGFAGSDE